VFLVHVPAATQQRGHGRDQARRDGEVEGDVQSMLERRRDQRAARFSSGERLGEVE